jgi:folate-dependent phosphoribosylglycinamide formyltransferase PurN
VGINSLDSDGFPHDEFSSHPTSRNRGKADEQSAVSEPFGRRPDPILSSWLTVPNTDVRTSSGRKQQPFLAEQLFASSFVPLTQTSSGATLYGPFHINVSHVRPRQPLRAIILTSIRDVGVQENVGQFERSGDPKTYTKGTLETALEACQDDRLGGFLEIVGIITDDREKDLAGTDFVAHPSTVGRWILPRDMRTSNGTLASDITFNIPSTFRSLPLSDVTGRSELKRAFEGAVFQLFEHTQADVIISDHFLARIDYLLRPDAFNLSGRVLNTHPGITRADHPYPCLGNRPYDLARLHAKGWHQSDDKKLTRVPVHTWAGATFHIVTHEIDRGPVLCDAELTPVSPNDSDISFARKMYQTSKYHAFIDGIRHYASSFYPLVAEPR